MESINVIIGNPPYSAGQKTANEDNANVKHPELENRVKQTYIKNAPEGNTNGLYNSYSKALRWASDRIGESGIIGFIIPSAWLAGSAEAGIRACIYEEFTEIYCLDLLGQKGVKGHGRNIFEYRGSSEGGTTVSTAIIILVKNPDNKKCTIRYASLSATEYEGEQKRNRVKDLKDISNVQWKIIHPDKHHDWLNQRGKITKEWEKLIPIGSKAAKKEKTEKILFKTYSNGLKTRRDSWVYNSNLNKLEQNIKRTIDYCNTQDPDNFKLNPKLAQWSPHISKAMKKLERLEFNKNVIRKALFRPFFKQYLYFDKTFANDTAQIPTLYPNADTVNPTIIVPDKTKGEFSTIVSDVIPDLQNIMNSQTFPLKVKKQITENVRQVAPPASSLQPPASSLQNRIWR